jgi:hypothetical protein
MRQAFSPTLRANAPAAYLAGLLRKLLVHISNRPPRDGNSASDNIGWPLLTPRTSRHHTSISLGAAQAEPRRWQDIDDSGKKFKANQYVIKINALLKVVKKANF